MDLEFNLRTQANSFRFKPDGSLIIDYEGKDINVSMEVSEGWFHQIINEYKAIMNEKLTKEMQAVEDKIAENAKSFTFFDE